MLGVCFRLGRMTGLDPIIFQILFIIWFFNDPMALLWYILLSVIL